MISKPIFKRVLCGAVTLCAMVLAHGAMAQDAVSAVPVDRLMNAVKASGSGNRELSVVRETMLRESATVLGAREGLRVQSCAIRTEIDRREAEYDRTYRFADLMMGRGIMPPIITEAKSSVSLTDTVMRVASAVYHLDAPARVVDVPPTWRDWINVGLSTDRCDGGPVDVPTHDQLKPQNAAEEAFFRAVLARSYQAGVQQARDILADNVARLERAYKGMRAYYDLYSRGMVSAPMIASSTDIVALDDPNTLVVGNTVIRITVPANFIDKPANWRPLGE